MLTESELDALTAGCREVPLTTSVYLDTEIVPSLMETVLDYMMHTTAVEKALNHFVTKRKPDIQSMDDLRACLASWPDTQEGNTELALYLWDYRLWTRAKQLRDLVDFLDRLGISTFEQLQEWAFSSTFKDFEGQVRGLGPAVYRWWLMRLGVATAKPDVHVIRFVGNCIGRPVTEIEAVQGVEEAANRLGIVANLLDWSIWEYSRGSG